MEKRRHRKYSNKHYLRTFMKYGLLAVNTIIDPFLGGFVYNLLEYYEDNNSLSSSYKDNNSLSSRIVASNIYDQIKKTIEKRRKNAFRNAIAFGLATLLSFSHCMNKEKIRYYDYETYKGKIEKINIHVKTTKTRPNTLYYLKLLTGKHASRTQITMEYSSKTKENNPYLLFLNDEYKVTCIYNIPGSVGKNPSYIDYIINTLTPTSVVTRIIEETTKGTKTKYEIFSIPDSEELRNLCKSYYDRVLSESDNKESWKNI